MPVDINQQSLMPMAGPPPQAGTPTIPLATLIDFIIQRTYHELNVLSELLPRKNDMERYLSAIVFVCNKCTYKYAC